MNTQECVRSPVKIVGSNPTRSKDVCCECYVLSGRCLCDGLITRPEESYRLLCVVVFDLETSWTKRPWTTGSCCEKKERKKGKKKRKLRTPLITNDHTKFRKNRSKAPLLTWYISTNYTASYPRRERSSNRRYSHPQYRTYVTVNGSRPKEGTFQNTTWSQCQVPERN